MDLRSRIYLDTHCSESPLAGTRNHHDIRIFLVHIYLPLITVLKGRHPTGSPSQEPNRLSYIWRLPAYCSSLTQPVPGSQASPTSFVVLGGTNFFTPTRFRWRATTTRTEHSLTGTRYCPSFTGLRGNTGKLHQRSEVRHSVKANKGQSFSFSFLMSFFLFSLLLPRKPRKRFFTYTPTPSLPTTKWLGGVDEVTNPALLTFKRIPACLDIETPKRFRKVYVLYLVGQVQIYKTMQKK